MSSPVEGPLADVLSKISALPNGRPLARVLETLKAEIGESKVRVSSDGHRANVELPNGKQIAVRVTSAKRSHTSSSRTFRFKRPVNLHKYERIYLGGLAEDGTAIVRNYRPNEIAHLKTITVQARR